MLSTVRCKIFHVEALTNTANRIVINSIKRSITLMIALNFSKILFKNEPKLKDKLNYRVSEINLSSNSLEDVSIEPFNSATKKCSLKCKVLKISEPYELWIFVDALYRLDFDDNHLRVFPAIDPNITSLVELNLSNNIISNFPEEISSLSTLETLELSNNFIKEIPDWIGELRNLRVLDLSKNEIKQLPRSIVELKLEDKGFNIRVNKLIYPPQEEADKGFSNICSIMQFQGEAVTKSTSYHKLIIIGDSQLYPLQGLAHHYSASVEINRADIHSLLTCESSMNNCEGITETIERVFNVWNFSDLGLDPLVQSVFFSMYAHYAIVWNMDLNSSQDMNRYVQYWIDLIQEKSPGSSIFIIGTYTSNTLLNFDLDFLVDQLRKQIKLYEHFCRANIVAIEILDITDVRESLLSSEIFSNLLRSTLNNIEIPERNSSGIDQQTYEIVNRTISEMQSQQQSTVTMLELVALVEREIRTLETPSMVELSLLVRETIGFIHRLGEITWINSNTTAGFIFLESAWLITRINHIISFKDGSKTSGIISRESILSLLDCESELCDAIISICEWCSILAPIKSKSQVRDYVVTSQLSETPSSEVKTLTFPNEMYFENIISFNSLVSPNIIFKILSEIYLDLVLLKGIWKYGFCRMFKVQREKESSIESKNSVQETESMISFAAITISFEDRRFNAAQLYDRNKSPHSFLRVRLVVNNFGRDLIFRLYHQYLEGIFNLLKQRTSGASMRYLCPSCLALQRENSLVKWDIDVVELLVTNQIGVVSQDIRESILEEFHNCRGDISKLRAWYCKGGRYCSMQSCRKRVTPDLLVPIYDDKFTVQIKKAIQSAQSINYLLEEVAISQFEIAKYRGSVVRVIGVAVDERVKKAIITTKPYFQEPFNLKLQQQCSGVLYEKSRGLANGLEAACSRSVQSTYVITCEHFLKDRMQLCERDIVDPKRALCLVEVSKLDGETVSYIADIGYRGTCDPLSGVDTKDICILKLLHRARLQHGITVLCILDDPQSNVDHGLQCCSEISCDASIDQVVCLMGYPINTHPNLNANWGKIERCDNGDSIIVDIFSGPGNSGGPLFDLSGRLLGVSAQSLTTVLSCNTIISPISHLAETISLLQ